MLPNFCTLPGGDLVELGLRNLADRAVTDESLLVSIGRPRLVQLGIDVPIGFDDPEHRLYVRLSGQFGDAAHGRYNALIRRLVSFERAYAQALAKLERGHERDLADVEAMFSEGLVEPGRLRELFDEIEPCLYRFPAIDPASFRTAVSGATNTPA